MSARLLVPVISGLPNKIKKKQLEEGKCYSVPFLQGFTPGSGTGEPELTRKVQERAPKPQNCYLPSLAEKKSQMKSYCLATLTKLFST